MTENRHLAIWQRSLAGLVALAAALVLSACGGGAGAPNNVFNSPGPITLSPPAAVAYSGVPIVLTINGGTPPYKAFSSNSGIAPVVQDVAGSTIVIVPGTVSDDSDVTITVQDNPNAQIAPNKTTAVLTVRNAPMLNSLTITPSSADCGTNAICSGQTGTASVTVLGSQGGPLAGRVVQFDVVAGPYGIVSNDGAQTIVASLRATSDSSGHATVIIKANVNAPTQMAQLRATDLTSGQTLVGNFLIQQVTDGTKVLTVVPGEAKITTAYKGICSSGFTTEYFIYGGTPPYRVTSTFPDAVVLNTSSVNVAGGSFRATTNGTCVDPLTFSILDATGLQTTAKLSNIAGDADVPVVTPPALAVAPASYTGTACGGTSRSFILTGGTTPYSGSAVNSVTGSIAVTGTAGTFTVGPLPAGATTTTVVFTDQSQPQKSVTATITCT